MGTTADKAAYLLDTKAAIRSALLDGGEEVPEDTPFRAYADKVRALSAAAGGWTPLTSGSIDESGTTVRLAIPAGAGYLALTPYGVSGTRLLVSVETVTGVPDAVSWNGSSFYIRRDPDAGEMVVESPSTAPGDVFGRYAFYP